VLLLTLLIPLTPGWQDGLVVHLVVGIIITNEFRANLQRW
jgi:hypothetical protein